MVSLWQFLLCLGGLACACYSMKPLAFLRSFSLRDYLVVFSYLFYCVIVFEAYLSRNSFNITFFGLDPNVFPVLFIVPLDWFDPILPRTLYTCIFFHTVVMSPVVNPNDFKVSLRTVFLQCRNSFCLFKVDEELYMGSTLFALLELSTYVRCLGLSVPEFNVFLRGDCRIVQCTNEVVRP
jgi:hypothetical protein